MKPTDFVIDDVLVILYVFVWFDDSFLPGPGNTLAEMRHFKRKESTVNNFNSNYFDYLTETLIKYLKAVELCVKDTVYEFLSSVLRLFDDNSLGGAKSLNLIYELCFFCLDQNEKLCERFWAECKCEDRNNITILLSNLLELFPISIEKTLRFLSLLAKTSVYLCEDV